MLCLECQHRLLTTSMLLVLQRTRIWSRQDGRDARSRLEWDGPCEYRPLIVTRGMVSSERTREEEEDETQ